MQAVEGAHFDLTYALTADAAELQGDLATAAVALVTAGLVLLLVRRTKLGLGLRATANATSSAVNAPPINTPNHARPRPRSWRSRRPRWPPS